MHCGLRGLRENDGPFKERRDDVKWCKLCDQEIYPGQKHKKSDGQYRHFKPDCDGAKAVSVPRPPFYDAVLIYHTISLPKVIASRTAISERQRNCHLCDAEIARISDDGHYFFDEGYIYSGDQYTREVVKISVGGPWENRTGIEIRYSHYPECPWLEPPYMCELEEEEVEEFVVMDIRLPDRIAVRLIRSDK